MKDCLFTATLYYKDEKVTIQTERKNFYRGAVRNCLEHISKNDPSVDDGEAYGCFTFPQNIIRLNALKLGTKANPKINKKPFPYLFATTDMYFHLISYRDNTFRITTNWRIYARELSYYWRPTLLDVTTSVFEGMGAKNIISHSKITKA